MKTLRSVCLVFFAVWLLAVSTKASETPLKDTISLRVSVQDGGLLVEYINTSPQAKRLWRDANSWGWDNVSFVLVRDGAAYAYRRNPNEGFTRNFPGYDEIVKGGSLKRTFSVADGSWIVSSGAPLSFKPGDLVIAIYCVKETDESKRLSVWSGIACGQTKLE